MNALIDIIVNSDKYLGTIIQEYGILVYPILFFIIFLETGVVITPFLPGDSLIFVAGTFAAQGSLNAPLLFFILLAAAILGDTLNYWIGNFFGERVFIKSRLFKKEYLEKTKEFYKKHGGKTIIYARFIPIIRTFAPFVAGVGKMNYLRFFSFNVVGGFLWTGLFVLAGYFFGTIPFVRDNLTVFIILIILTSFIPPIVEFFKERRKHKRNAY